ncbi:MAG TPA: hypothetical protein DCQ30_10245 [Acidimicrobiaceae bacterium]|nr:hypothetical protein [Acidimicrobiaceae bacterium]
MTMSLESIGGEILGKERGRVVAFLAGRTCEAEGCDTRLSIYNSRDRCAVHDFDASLMNFRSPSPTQNEPANRLARPSRGRRKTAA